MTTVGEIIQDNPSYSQGITFDPYFYKESLSTQKLQGVSEEDLSWGYNLAVFTEVMQKIVTIALLIIPAVTLLPVKSLIIVTGIALLNQMVIGTRKRGVTQEGFFKEIEQKGSLVACLDFEDKKTWLISELGYRSAIKVSLYALLKIMPWGSGILARLIIASTLQPIFGFLVQEVRSWTMKKPCLKECL